MTEPARGTRRRLFIVIAIAVIIIGGVVAATIVSHSREPVRSIAGTCGHLAAAKDLDRSLTSLDPDTLRERLRALDAAVTTAPADIEPQITALDRFVNDLLAQVDQAASQDRRTALADALAARADQIDAITSAGGSVQSWAAANCGIELGDATTTSMAQ